MLRADAWISPASLWFRRGRLKAENRLAGNAKIIAAPAYKRLLVIEPYLRRSIPVLIVLFLLVVAAARMFAMADWRDDIERDTKAHLGLAAINFARSLQLSIPDGLPQSYELRGLIDEAGRQASASGEWIFAVTDPGSVVIEIGRAHV